MNYKLKSLIVLMVLLGVVASLGMFMSGGSITGSSITPDIACYTDLDCNDRTVGTEDICKNPGTKFSLCINRRITD